MKSEFNKTAFPMSIANQDLQDLRETLFTWRENQDLGSISSELRSKSCLIFKKEPDFREN
jgi:hypothetical protein